MGSTPNAELILIQRLVAHAPRAWGEFVREYGPLVYARCSLVFRTMELDNEWLQVMDQLRANDFALIREFDGRSKLSNYLTLKLSNILGIRILSLIREGGEIGWVVFEGFFRNDIKRAISNGFRLSPGVGVLKDGTSYEDLYQEICKSLFENNYRRLTNYNGSGTYGGYIGTVLRNLCLDLARAKDGRERMPKAISRSSSVDQQVYDLLVRDHHEPVEVVELLSNKTGHRYARKELLDAIARVEKVLRRKSAKGGPIIESIDQSTENPEGSNRKIDFPSSTNNPEQAVIEAQEEQEKQKVLQTLSDRVQELPTRLQLYVKLRYYRNPPMPPGEIARRMGLEEKDIYGMRTQVISILARELRRASQKNSNCPSN